MAARGKSINLFLMDGTATGRVKCTLANWTGVKFAWKAKASGFMDQAYRGRLRVNRPPGPR